MTTANLVSSLPLPAIYYDHRRQVYWCADTKQEWIMITETAAKRILKSHGFVGGNSAEELSPLDQAVLDIQLKQNIAYAGSLAGFRKGLVEMNGSNILVTTSPRLIPPKPGGWPILGKMLENMLNDELGDQRPYFYGWLKIALEALQQSAIRPGQALCFAGEAESGKSLLQALITEMLGGRAAKPYQFMTGATSFNSEVFEAEHLMIEDEQASTDIRARRAFGAQLKQVTASRDQRCHAKNRTGLVLTPFWRLTISVNDEPENLMVLPPIDPSIEDKIMLLKVHKHPMPMPTGGIAERETFWKTILAELPAFMDFVLNWQIPPDMQSSRYGILHYHHPEILAALDELAPELRLLALYDQENVNSSGNISKFEGTAVQLEQALLSQESSVRVQAQHLFTFNTACGVYLGRLRKKANPRVDCKTVNGRTEWTISPPCYQGSNSTQNEPDLAVSPNSGGV